MHDSVHTFSKVVPPSFPYFRWRHNPLPKSRGHIRFFSSFRHVSIPPLSLIPNTIYLSCRPDVLLLLFGRRGNPLVNLGHIIFPDAICFVSAVVEFCSILSPQHPADNFVLSPRRFLTFGAYGLEGSPAVKIAQISPPGCWNIPNVTMTVRDNVV